MSIVSLTYISADFMFDVIDGKKVYGMKRDGKFMLIMLSILVLQLLWNAWCFAVILRCHEYIKNMKMAQTREAQMI
uniref:Uncharacterized protein n=1 Tax=Panagrolaimus sp. ES5 TaxID=591445 RepID=A0AC34GIJ7_9BILA